MRIRRFEYERVVVGGSLSALLYSYYTGAPLVFIHPKVPFRFDYFEPQFDLDGIVPQGEPQEFVTFDRGPKVFGCAKWVLWEKLFFILSLGGQIPFAHKVNSLRIDEELRVVGKRSYEIGFKELRVFDDTGLQGISQKFESEEKKYRVLDWISVHSGTTHDCDFLDALETSAIERVIFYPSDRIDGNHNKKDIVCVSEMTEGQLNDYRFSNTYVRFEVLKMMKDAGIRGARNGRDQLNPERYKYYAIKLENAEREEERLGFSSRADREDIVLDARTPEEVINHFRGSELQGYTGKITECLQKLISI